MEPPGKREPYVSFWRDHTLCVVLAGLSLEPILEIELLNIKSKNCNNSKILDPQLFRSLELFGLAWGQMGLSNIAIVATIATIGLNSNKCNNCNNQPVPDLAPSQPQRVEYALQSRQCVAGPQLPREPSEPGRHEASRLTGIHPLVS